MSYQSRPYILAETNWKTVQEADYQVAVLPWGATEAHNYHLPYATDNIQADHVVAEAARLAWDQGTQVIVLPCVPFGVNTGQIDIDLCLNMNPSTQYAVLADLTEVVAAAGIEKLVIVNGHGGNHFKQMLRELYGQYPEVFACTLNWFQAVNWNDYFDDPGDHAGEMETSAIMHIAPQWVRPLNEAGDGAAKTYKPKGLREGWVSAQRHWPSVTEDTGVGNPYAATAEKGEAYLNACAKNIAEFFVELAETDLSDMYV